MMAIPARASQVMLAHAAAFCGLRIYRAACCVRGRPQFKNVNDFQCLCCIETHSESETPRAA